MGDQVMPYVATSWLNDSPPPMSAANLNKMTNEAKSQALAKSIAHTLPTWADGVAPAVSSATPWNEIERVVEAVAVSLGLTYTKTTWSSGWVPPRNAGRLNQIEQQLAVNRNAIEAPPAAPSIPTGLAATAGNGQVVLTWNANPAGENVDGYQVYITSPVDVTLDLDVDALTYTATGLSNGTTYQFRISAHNASGYGPYSSTPVQATPSGPAPPPTTLKRGIAYIKLGSGQTYSNAEKYDTLWLTRNALPRPSIGNRVLTYMSGTNCTNTVDQGYGVNLTTARANNWILKNSGGAEIQNANFPDAFLGDVGDAAYQLRWCQNVEAMLAGAGVSGFYSDDTVNWGRLMGWTANQVPAKYPNQQAWDDAMVSFCQFVGGYLRPRGIYVAHNANAWLPNDEESNNGMRLARWWSRIGPHADGIMIETWMSLMNWGIPIRLAGPAWSQNWDAYRNLHRFTNGEYAFPVTGGTVSIPAGCDIICLDSAPDLASTRYCLATFLLDYKRTWSSYIQESTGDPWNTEFDKMPMGAPTGDATFSGGVWTRNFANGTVTVNPTTGASTIT